MEEIRAFASDELLQLSHGGNEVGGVLFGTRHEDHIRVVTWRPIACDHTQGESLRLSHTDRMNLAVQLEVARQNPDLKDLRPLGWLVSHLHAGVSLSASDLEVYNGFFPEAWQVALVICPKGNRRAQAGFFVREADDKLQSEASYQCFDLQPLGLPAIATDPIAPNFEASNPQGPTSDPPAPQAGVPEHGQTPQTVPVAQPVATVPSVPKAMDAAARPTPPPAEPIRFIEPQNSAPALAEPVRRVAPRNPAPSAPEISLPAPSFEIEEPLPTHERWLWAIPIVLALGIAAFMLYQRRVPSPNASIALHALSEAQTIQLAWDANSRAVRESDRAEMQINDGGKNSQVSLTSDQLHAGKMSYQPQSSDVGFTMTVYPANGEPIHDSTRLIAPAFNPPAQPPPPVPASPPLVSPPQASPAPPADAEQTALRQEVQRLKDELSKERARDDDLQNVVRILENRLGIPREAPKTKRRP